VPVVNLLAREEDMLPGGGHGVPLAHREAVVGVPQPLPDRHEAAGDEFAQLVRERPPPPVQPPNGGPVGHHVAGPYQQGIPPPEEDTVDDARVVVRRGVGQGANEQHPRQPGLRSRDVAHVLVHVPERQY